MAANAEAKIVIRGETKQAQDEVEKLNEKLGGLDLAGADARKSMGLLSGVLTTQVGRGMQDAGRFILDTVASFAQAGREGVRAGRQLEAVLKSTGGVAGLTAREVQGMADALARATNFQDDAILQGQNVLLTYTQIGKETFPRASEAALDMAAALGMDLTSAAEAVGRALGYPSHATSALVKQGFRFTEQQIEQIEAMEAAGDMAGAQAIILEELELAYGGVARATADAGTQLANTFEQVKGDIGKTFLPALDEAARAIIPVLQQVRAWIEANPDLAKTIGLIALAVGGFLTVGGTLVVLLGSVTAAAAALGIALGPVSVIGLAIVGLTALVVTLRENWGWMAQAMRDNVGAAVDFLVEKLNALMGTIKAVIERINVFQQARDLKELATFQVKDYTIPKRAAGGPASGLTLVGERGPELVSLPGGSYVHSNRDSRRMLGGASISIGQVTVTNEADEDRLIAKLTRLIQLQSRQAA